MADPSPQQARSRVNFSEPLVPIWLHCCYIVSVMPTNAANKRSASAARRPAAKKVLSGKKPAAKRKPVAQQKSVARNEAVARKKVVAKPMARRAKPASAAPAAQERSRITARVPVQVRDQLERAAAMMGAANVGQFIVQAAVTEARRIIQSETVIELAARDFHAFAEALQQPPPPSEALEAALEQLTKAGSRDDRADRLDWQPRPRGV